MTAFRAWLLILSVVIVIYTAMVITNHGWNLVEPFFSEIKTGTWQGQFNLDFMCFLMLTALWTAWRHHFSPAGVALGLVAGSFGIMFLAPYLLYLSVKTGGDMKALMLGPKRA